MHHTRKLIHAIAVVALGAACTSTLAQSGGYPNKPVRIIIGFAAGGVTDIGARYYAGLLSKRLGQPFVVENRPGAAGTIAARAVIPAAPDGYTLLFAGGSGISSIFVKDGAVDALKDLAPISNMHKGSWFMMASATLPVRNLGELVEYSKANPGKLNVGEQSAISKMAMAWLRNRTGLTYTSVPYKSGGAVATALRTGEVHFAFDALTGYIPHIDAGTLRAILVASDTRSPVAPNVLNSNESGVPGFVADYTQGFMAPVGTPRDVIATIAAATKAALAPAEVQAYVLKTIGAKAVGSTAEEFRKAIEDEIAFWAEAARIADYKPQ